jgi:hypothetical protein
MKQLVTFVLAAALAATVLSVLSSCSTEALTPT